MTVTDAGQAGRIQRENPARPAEVVGEVAGTPPAAADALVALASAAQSRWSAMPVRDRAAMLAAAWPLAGHDELARLLTRELGKPLADAAGEIAFAHRFSEWVVANAPDVFADRTADDAAGRLVVEQRPFGVVVAITPWNAPIILTMLKVAPALVAGNAVVVKPSPLAPLAVDGLLRALAASLPAGILQVVHGGADLGAALVGHPGVAKVVFTGGGTTARHIASAAGSALTPTVLELGGNDPAIVLDDAEITEALAQRLLVATYATTGQVCMAVKRLYVHAARRDELVEALQSAGERCVVVGDPLDPGVTVGPLVTRAAADRVAGLVASAVRAGGRRIDIGVLREVDPAGYWLQPALVLDPPEDTALVADEQFGPALPVLTFTDLDDVVRRANSGDLGLGASVWSADEDRAFDLARRLEAGFRFVNTHNRAGLTLRAPFGGVKRSGHGREYAEDGLREYTQSCVIHAPAAARAGEAAALPAAAYPAG